MARGLTSKFGKVEMLKNNPREIRDGQFNALSESLDRDPDFMDVRKIVVWEVPGELSGYEEGKCPFAGQEGKLVVIGGNQRCRVLQAKGKKEIPDEWVIEAKDKEGNWWSVDRAMRFILVDNSQEGNSGYNDYEKLRDFFDEATMRMSGVDFSEFVVSEDEKVKDDIDTEGEGPTEEMEEGESGEKSEELQDFISEREKTRMNLKEINETGFHLCMIFDSVENKARFVSGSGLCGSGGKIAGNGTTYVDLVFESEGQKMEFAKGAGLLATDDEGDPRLMYGMFCDGRYIAEKMGIEMADSGLHFRDRKVDSRLAAMAREDYPQKSPEEIAQEQYAKLIQERKELGMKAGKEGGVGKRGKKYSDAEDLGNGPGIYVDMGED